MQMILVAAASRVVPDHGTGLEDGPARGVQKMHRQAGSQLWTFINNTLPTEDGSFWR
ncbi:MAG: hypothetical protein IH898_14920 [Planctomycetes bacterium]|nr:hypothetical protein [Planctomycetota bacterium]